MNPNGTFTLDKHKTRNIELFVALVKFLAPVFSKEPI